MIPSALLRAASTSNLAGSHLPQLGGGFLRAALALALAALALSLFAYSVMYFAILASPALG